MVPCRRLSRKFQHKGLTRSSSTRGALKPVRAHTTQGSQDAVSGSLDGGQPAGSGDTCEQLYRSLTASEVAALVRLHEARRALRNQWSRLLCSATAGRLQAHQEAPMGDVAVVNQWGRAFVRTTRLVSKLVVLWYAYGLVDACGSYDCPLLDGDLSVFELLKALPTIDMD